MPRLLGSIRNHEAWFPAHVRRGVLVLGKPAKFRVVIDTGFTGCLSLPLAMLRRLRADPLGKETYRLADGRRVGFTVHGVPVQVPGRMLQVEALRGGGGPLIGMELLAMLGRRFELNFDGRTALLTPRPYR